MAITRRTPATTVPASASSITVTKPASVAAGDRAFVYVGGKYSGATAPTMATTGGSSWTLVGSVVSTTGAGQANDIGDSFGYVFAKDLTATDVSNAWVVTAGATLPNTWTTIAVAYTTSLTWADSIPTPIGLYRDNTTTASTSFGPWDTEVGWLNPTTAPQINAGDHVAAFGTIPTDAAASISSAQLSFAGTTQSALTTTYVENALNNDTASVATFTEILTGSQNPVSPGTWSWTLNASVNAYGPMVLLPIRESSGGGGGTAARPRNISVNNPALHKASRW